MKIVIIYPDDRTPAGNAEVNLTQYRLRNRRYHAGVTIWNEGEWIFQFDKILRKHNIMRLSPWKIQKNYDNSNWPPTNFTAIVMGERKN